MQWTGRVDGHTVEHCRLHQWIKPYDPKIMQDTGIILQGFAIDEGVQRNQGRAGAASAPNVIRQQLSNMAWHYEIPLYDAGNIDNQENTIPLETAQTLLSSALAKYLQTGYFPITLGGGHEVAYGSFGGLLNYHKQLLSTQSQPLPKIGIINFDAHFDLRDQATASSGTPFLQAAKQLQQYQHPFHYLCLGINPYANTQALFNTAEKWQVDYITDQILNESPEIAERVIQTFLEKVDCVYLSIDLDVFPYTQAPGVSAPAVLGVPLNTVRKLLSQIIQSNKVSLMDIAEYNPLFDQDHHTAKLAAFLVMDVINNMANANTIKNSMY